MQRTSANRCRGERHKVAVIGAGAAGLAAARELLRSGHEVVVFEASRRVGGLWNAPPQGASEALPPSAVYDHLRTNLPRALMAFRDFPFTDRETDPGAAADPLRASAHPLSFPHHSAVRAYLRRFAGEHDLLRHVRWGARIKHVELPGCGSADGGSSPGAPEFRLTLERQRAAEAFDAVAVCNGHFSEPFTPDLEGLSGFAGEVLHSQSYRRPERFTGRRVAVIGAQASGLDLAHALLEVAAEVHLFASNPTELTVAAGITLHGAARGFEGAAVRSVRGHAGGEEHRVEVDTVIFCTGYRYSFPFLPKGCVELGRGSVKPLYLDCLHALQPRMAFVGLPFKVVPFPQFELQGKLFARTLSGELPLPGGGTLYSLARDHYRSLDASGVTQGLCHGARQFAYAAELCTLLGEPLWPAWFAPVYDAVGRARARFPSSYRDRFPDLARSVWEGAPDSRAVTAAAGFPLRPKPRSLR